MYNVAYIKNCLFFDIETISGYENFETCLKENPIVANIWLEKASQSERYKSNPEGFYNTHSGLYPEYAKIVTISFGYWDSSDNKWKIEHLDIKDISERDMLYEFARRLNTDFRNHIIAGFNIKNFDMPFVYRRMIVNKIMPPTHFNNFEKKPWEVKGYDLYRVWLDSNALSGMCNFELICNLMGVPSSKEGEVKGKDVTNAYYSGKIDQISEYCRRDVQASIKLAMAFSLEKLEEAL